MTKATAWKEYFDAYRPDSMGEGEEELAKHTFEMGYIMAIIDKNKGMDFKKVFDAHWPVIQAAKTVRDDYAGDPENGIPPRICPDSVGELINAINGAEKLFNIQLNVEEAKDGKEKNHSHG